jgi:hypothetical protein
VSESPRLDAAPTSAKAVQKIVILKTDREEVGSVVCNGMQL